MSYLPAKNDSVGLTSALEGLVAACDRLDNFAWACVQTDCDEAQDYLRALVQNMREALAYAQALLDAVGKEPATAEPSNERAVDLRKALVEILDTCGARGTYDAFRYHEAKLQAERVLAQTGTADDLIPRATVDAMREMVGDVPVEEIHASIRKIAADPELVRQFNDLTLEQVRELLSDDQAHCKKERPIQVGDTVRHKVLNCLEWPSRTIRSIETDKPTTWMEDWGPVAYFHEGGFWRLSQLERVDPPSKDLA